MTKTHHLFFLHRLIVHHNSPVDLVLALALVFGLLHGSFECMIISNFDITSYIISISYLKVVTLLYLRTSVTFYFFLFDIATSATSFV